MFRVRTKQRIFVIIMFLMFYTVFLSANRITDASIYEQDHISPEEIDTPFAYAHKILVKDGYLFVATRNGTVWRSSDGGRTWTQVFDAGYGLKLSGFYIMKDSEGNLYASMLAATGKVYRSTDNGETWDLLLEQTELLFTPATFEDLGNGTIIAGTYGGIVLLYRSDDWGETWYVWKNFTQIFPQYAVPRPDKPTELMMKHIHCVVYFKNCLFVSFGDYFAYTIASDDGGNTWYLNHTSTFTAKLVLDDRVLLGVDMGTKGIYMFKDGEYRYVYVPNRYVAPYIVFVHFVMDDAGLIYVPIGYSFIGSNVTILVSPDKGETWFDYYHLPISGDFSVDIAFFNGYIYYTTGTSDTKIYRIPAPAVEEVVHKVKEDPTTFSVYGENTYTYSSMTSKALKNVNITLSNHTLRSYIPNPSFEGVYRSVATGSTPANWTAWAGQFTGTAISSESSDSFQGSKSLNLTINGNGTFYAYSDLFTLPPGWYFAQVRFKPNASFLNGRARMLINIPTSNIVEGIKELGARLFNFTDRWYSLEIYFYIDTPQDVRAYVIVETTNDTPICVSVLFDAYLLVRLSGDDAFRNDGLKTLTIDYWTNNLTSSTGSIEINGETYIVDSLPKIITLPYLYGLIKIKLTGVKVLNITISGQEVLTLTNGSIFRKTNNIYIGRWYKGIAITKNIEKSLVVLADTLSNVTSASFIDQRLHVVLEGPTGVTGTTVIYCPYDPVAIYEDGELKTTNYVWNPSAKLLTVNVTFSSPVKLDIYFAVPKVESHKVDGMILGYVFPGGVTVNLDISLYTYTGEAVSTTTRITVEIYDSSGKLVYSTAKRETITQQPKTVTVNIPSLETGTYIVKIKLENPDTGETLDTYSFLLKVTYPWWLWTAIIAIIIAATGIAVLISGKKQKLQLSSFPVKI